MNKFKHKNISPLLKQLISDLKPAPERLNMQITIQRIGKNRIKSFCVDNRDLTAYNKMSMHELKNEPVNEIIAIKQKNKKKIEKKYLNKILLDMGYNLNVLFAKKNYSDFDAAINIGGYSVPGWKILLKSLKKINSNITVFLGKRFGPGNSRLHIRFFEGKIYWYIIVHIDKYNWLRFNFLKIKESHSGAGNGDYKNGIKYFLKSLNYYLNSE